VPGDRYGARTSLIFIAMLYLASALGCFLAWNLGSLIFFRVLAGLAVGASSVLAPVYIAEIAPTDKRGMLVGAFQLNVVLGILVAYLSNAVVTSLALGALDWHVKFAVTGIPALVLLAMMFTIPDSPRWLTAKGRTGEARDVLQSLGSADADAEVASYARAEAATAAPRLSWTRHRRPILLAFGIASFNQFSGINAILYYLNNIFAAAGFDSVSADRQAIVIGACNLLFTALALTVIDRFGRKTLLLVGAVGVTIALAGVAAVFMSNASRTAAPAAHHVHRLLRLQPGRGDLGLYQRDLPQRCARPRPEPRLLDPLVYGCGDRHGLPAGGTAYEGLPFIFFAACMAAQFVVVLLFFPETKKRSLEALGTGL
jgi:sugar porter (SP) family MFS transporter